MKKDRSILAVIPARAGSKGLPGKNVKKLLGHPLLSWPILAAKGSQYIDKVIVSTDSEEYARIAIDYGAEVPFLRPKELAKDTSATFDVLKHALDSLAPDEMFDFIVLLEPTSPQTESGDIDAAIDKLFDHPSAKSIVGIAKSEAAHPAFSVNIKSDGTIKPLYRDEFVVLRRQEIDDVYYFSGSLYLSEVATLLETKTFYHQHTLGYEGPKWKAGEIDDEVDFLVIESLMNYYLNQ